MPLYMDRHDLAGASAADLAAAHLKDLEVQGRHDVEFVNYWFDYARQHAFCLARGPSRDAVDAVHREAHGQIANQVIEVDGDALERFMGGVQPHPPGDVYEDSAFRAILFTDLAGSTELTQRLGDAGAMDVLRIHDAIVRDALRQSEGTQVKHTGDGIMASFRSVTRAIECAVAVQRRLKEAEADGRMPVGVRIGISAGEPVTEAGDLFGAVVQLAARLSSRAAPRTILVTHAVRDLAGGKGFRFGSPRSVRLKGFGEPIRVSEVAWLDAG